jgi:histidine ammonia-lyase
MLFSDLIACVSLEAFDGRIEPFSELIHFIRPHKGQNPSAYRIPGGSENYYRKIHVQDPYSFRCIPGFMELLKMPWNMDKKSIQNRD